MQKSGGGGAEEMSVDSHQWIPELKEQHARNIEASDVQENSQILHDPNGYVGEKQEVTDSETEGKREKIERIQKGERVTYESQVAKQLDGGKKRAKQAKTYDAVNHLILGIDSEEWAISDIGEIVVCRPVHMPKRR